MFDDILGEKKIENTGNNGDAKPTSFSEVWAAKQRQIDSLEEEFEEEYLQIEYTGI